MIRLAILLIAAVCAVSAFDLINRPKALTSTKSWQQRFRGYPGNYLFICIIYLDFLTFPLILICLVVFRFSLPFLYFYNVFPISFQLLYFSLARLFFSCSAEPELLDCRQQLVLIDYSYTKFFDAQISPVFRFYTFSTETINLKLVSVPARPNDLYASELFQIGWYFSILRNFFMTILLRRTHKIYHLISLE